MITVMVVAKPVSILTSRIKHIKVLGLAYKSLHTHHCSIDLRDE